MDRARALRLTRDVWTSARIAQAVAVREDTVRFWCSDFVRGRVDALRAHPAWAGATQGAGRSPSHCSAFVGACGKHIELKLVAPRRRDRALRRPHQFRLAGLKGAPQDSGLSFQGPRQTHKLGPCADKLDRVGLRLVQMLAHNYAATISTQGEQHFALPFGTLLLCR